MSEFPALLLEYHDIPQLNYSVWELGVLYASKILKKCGWRRGVGGVKREEGEKGWGKGVGERKGVCTVQHGD